MKVLFLDIDGVLNSTQSAREHGSFMTLIDEAVEHIIELQSHNGVELVLSSTWRKKPMHEKYLMDIYNIPLFDRTPVLPGLKVTRGEEIARWLHFNKQVTHYCIVDDDSDMLPEQLPFFVQTNTEHGLQFADFLRIRSILKLPPRE